MGKIIGLFFIAIILLTPFNAVLAEEKVKLSDKEQAAVQNFAAALLDTPIGVAFKAQLEPPRTTYRAEFVEKDFETLADRAYELIDVPKNIASRQYIEVKSKQNLETRLYADDNKMRWSPTIPCGTWIVDDRDELTLMSDQQGVWSHPNEGAKKCPHKEGTDHPGTIAVTGNYIIALDYKGTTPATQILKGTWSYDCKYTEGSKSGSVPCEVKLVSWEGQYGKMAPPVSSQQTQKDKSSQQVVLVAAGLGALIAGAFYFFRRIR